MAEITEERRSELLKERREAIWRVFVKQPAPFLDEGIKSVLIGMLEGWIHAAVEREGGSADYGFSYVEEVQGYLDMWAQALKFEWNDEERDFLVDSGQDRMFYEQVSKDVEHKQELRGPYLKDHYRVYFESGGRYEIYVEHWPSSPDMVAAESADGEGMTDLEMGLDVGPFEDTIMYRHYPGKAIEPA